MLLAQAGGTGPRTSPELPDLEENPQAERVPVTSPGFIFLLREKALKTSISQSFWLFLLTYNLYLKSCDEAVCQVSTIFVFITKMDRNTVLLYAINVCISLFFFF